MSLLKLDTRQKQGVFSGGISPGSWRGPSGTSNIARKKILPVVDSYFIQIQWGSARPERFPQNCDVLFISLDLTSQIECTNCVSGFLTWCFVECVVLSLMFCLHGLGKSQEPYPKQKGKRKKKVFQHISKSKIWVMESSGWSKSANLIK